MSDTFGLDIGTTSIKALSLKKGGNSFSIESMGIGPTPQKGIMSESNEDLHKFAEAVRQVITSANIKQKEVNVALPESQVYTKIIEMPALSEKELAAALKYEMEQYIPLPLDQVKTDWQVLSPSTAQNKTSRILLVAASLALIKKYETVLDELGLVPSTIETEMLSVHRAIFPLVNTASSNMIVHMGAATTNIAVVENGELIMVFTVDKGGIAITRAISLDLGIDITQADSYKKAYGLNKDAFEGKIGKSLFPILESILGDIRKTMLLYKEKNPNQPITQMILSGGSAQLPGVDIYFTNQLNIQVVLGSSFQVYDMKNVPPEIGADSLSFNVVSGLALKDAI
jgi:type IV pilus assembly protein PilM